MTKSGHMRTAAVSRLKAELSRYLSRVKAGEEILVTERNVPVARIVPVASTTAADEGPRELERQGLIRLGSGKLPRGFWKLPRPRDPKGAVRKAVTAERKGGW